VNPPDAATAPAATDLERLSVDTIRVLAMDAVEAANSGHPGTPMALAPVAYTLFAKVMNHDPRDPGWPDRDRFVLSAGHASMLLYASLHLSGYDLALEDLKQFRQWGSRTPGHPERERPVLTPGVETTTGPLGQGIGNAVGMTMAERALRERYGSEVIDHRIYTICSDGDLMEGVSSEASSLAGHLKLGRLIAIYDDNTITIDGHTDLAFAGEDVEARYRAYGWRTFHLPDVNDLAALEATLREAASDDSAPTLIRVNSVIAWPSPNKRNTPGAHGAPLGADEVAATKQELGWDPDQTFVVPDGVREHFSAVERGEALRGQWQERYEAWRVADADRAAEWDRAWAGKPEPGLEAALTSVEFPDKPSLATREANNIVMKAIGPCVPTMVGGSADLSSSVKTGLPGGDFTAEHAGPNVHWGVREHAMGSAVNGLALHGGIVRPYGSTFLIFSDYMRPALRLSALMQLPVAWVYSHDSLGVGEDGPTHQPIEQLATLRAIPGLTVIRPGDAAETTEAWRVILEELDGPAVLVLSRQGLPVLERGEGAPYASASLLSRGAYVLAEAEGGHPRASIVATGSELGLAVEARKRLAADGIDAQVVSMPSWELFAAQPKDEREEVLPRGVPSVSVEAATTFGWERWVDRSVGVDRFGASAPGATVLDKLGITVVAVVEAVQGLL
jgi:transketolase